MKRSLPFLIAASLCLSATAYGQNRIYVNEYLNIGVGGRGLSMSGAVTATANDVTGAYWNPAALMQLKPDFQVGLMHAEYFSGNAKYDYGAVAMPLKGKKRALGFSVLRFAIDDIPNTIDYVQPDGSFDESKLKSMSAGDYAFLLTYAQGVKIFRNQAVTTNIGANAKVIYRNLGSMATAWGVGVDVGLQAAWKQWRFGLMAKDVTTTYTAWSFNLSERDKQVFGQTGNEIPIKSYEIMYPRLNLGVARHLLPEGKKIQLLAELAADLTTDGRRNTLLAGNTFSLDPHAGLEASYKDVIYLRAGIGNFQRVLDDRDTTNQQQITIYQPTAGVGVKLGSLVIDYAFTSLQTQSNPLYSHIFSLRLDINRGKRASQTMITEPEETTEAP